MANNSPTIVAASLSDDQLKKSIDSLVTHVDEAMKKMVQSTNNAVGEMEAKLKSLGNLKIGSGGSADGGAYKRTKSQNAETDAVEKNIAARDKQIKKNQETAMSFDQMAKAQQVAIRSANPSGIRNADTLQTMNIQLDLLRERLREARQQYSSFVALAAHATTTGDKGLFQYATDGVHRYEQEVRNLIPQIRTLQSGIQQMGDVIAPQGHTIQNYVSSLQKANPELAMLNAQYKSGTSLLQDLSTSYASATQSAQRYTEEIRKQAAAIRATKEWQEKGHVIMGDVNYYDKERANASKREKQQLLSLEEQIVQVQQNEAEAARRAAQETHNQAQAQQRVQQSAAGTAKIIESVHEMQKRSVNFSKENASISNFAIELESAKRLSEKMKELREQYNGMNFGQRFSKEGQAIAQQIREISRQSQILNSQLNRPTKKEVFGLSEKTIDDIARKMQALTSYRSGLNASTQVREIATVNDEYGRLKKRMDEVLQKNQQMIASNTALGRSWNYMKNRLAFYFTVGASTQFFKNLVEVRSQYEMNERALGILINSAERGTQIFNELSQMALVSPYTLIELSSAAKQLTAYDIAAKDVVNTTRRLADMAAAVGIPIERLTYALGQIKAYGYLNARDARMFANAGIPLVKQLSEYYTELEGRLVSTADIYDRIKKKSIGYEEVTSVIAKMTDEGGKFYDFQAKMAETLKVQLANLTLAWNNMLNAMGEESQGVLVAGIGTLKQVFLHWKDIEHVLYELVVALGAYKAYQIITTRLMGATAASLDAQVLAMKRNKAAMLEKQSLTRKLTYDEAKLIATQNQVTAADYRNALSGKQLTKQKALLLVALNKNNVQLKAAVVNMGLLTTQEAASITTGRALAIVFKSIGISIRSAALAIKAFAASMWPLLVVGAIYELYHAWDSYGEHVKEVNKQAAEHAKEAFENIKQYLESDVTSALQDRLAKGGKVESDAAGQKAWDEMREKIELSSSASNAFIAKLMQINDINARLSAGFGYLEDIQRVAGVMQTLEEDAVNVSSTTLGGLFGEGVKDDLTDFINAYQKYISLNENLRQSGVGENYFNDQKKALEEFRGEVEKTTTSLYNIASKEGFNTNEQREFFEREISEIAQAEQMGAKETRIFRMQAEREYYIYARAQLVSQLEYQQGAQKAATEARIKDLDNEFGANKAMQESFFTWLTEKQDHAVKNMLRGKTQEEIKQGDWLKGANGKWVEEMARKFSQEYGVSFDDLHKLVMNANTWSINIPVFFQSIGQPLSDVQRDYEARTGKRFSSNVIIKDAKTQVEIVDALKKKQKEVAAEMETARKAGGKYWEDNKQRYKEENDALVADIHAYNALTDAEEKANKKRGKGGSKKDPLLDALKQEISLVEKLQSDYDKLSKSGASQADALDTIRGAYGKTIRLLNAQLGKYGLPQLDISQLITGKDPNKSLAHFKQTLNALVSKGLLTLERSKELEAVVEKFTLSAKTYNLDMITKGLNNELGKLKDEYELAVEFDANPELGGVFADMIGIDKETLSQLPKDFNGVVERLQQIVDDKLGDGKFSVLGNLNKSALDSWLQQNQVNIDSEKGKALVAITEYANKIRKDETKEQVEEWNKLLEKYAEYEYKKEQIRKEYERELATAQKRNAGFDVENAIRQSYERKTAKLDFDEFQRSAYWITATGNLSTLTNSALQTLIDKLEQYKKSAKNLDPKQIKEINKALVNLRKQVRSNNPFSAIANSLDEAASVADTFEYEMDDLDEKIKVLQEKWARQGFFLSDDDKKLLDEYIKKFFELKKAAEQASGVSFDQINKDLGTYLDKAKSITESFKTIADALGDEDLSKTAEAVDDIVGNFKAAEEGAETWGGWWGAVIGGLTDGIPKIIKWMNGDSGITEKVEDSELAVKRLENAYKSLEDAADDAYGTAEIGAKRAAITNKELQLAELKRQLQLEESRKEKNRDESKIEDLKGQIIDLELEIKNATKEIVNDLLDISSVGDAAENLVSQMIDAFKKGEDYMGKYSETFEDMIDNMIMKTIVGEVIGKRMEEIFKKVEEIAGERAKQTQVNAKNIFEGTDWELAYGWVQEYESPWWNDNHKGDMPLTSLTNTYEDWKKWLEWILTRSTEEGKAAYGKALENLEKIYGNLISVQPSDVEGIRDTVGNWKEGVKTEFESWMEAFGVMFGQDKEATKLSALQQGIQGITEDTGSAVESYLNIVSQRIFEQNDYLLQIRDTLLLFDFDTQLATISGILLQLQNSYQVQMAIRDMLQGWSNANGMAIRVEMV